MTTIKIFLAYTLLLLACSSHAADVIKCKDKSGGILFTENAALCADGSAAATGIAVVTPKTGKGSVNFDSPVRRYISEAGKYNIYVEESLARGDADLYQSSLAKLNATLDYVFSVMPQQSRATLSGMKFYLMWGEASPDGGMKSGMSYIRKGEPANYPYLDRRWENSVIVYSAENLMYLNDLWSRKAIFHELAHAWHLNNWPEKHAAILEPWTSAKNSNKYTDVRDINKKTIKSAYARKNQLEYFAELSAMYFVGGNYHPFNKQGLEKYDPKGFEMVKTLWN